MSACYLPCKRGLSPDFTFESLLISYHFYSRYATRYYLPAAERNVSDSLLLTQVTTTDLAFASCRFRLSARPLFSDLAELLSLSGTSEE